MALKRLTKLANKFGTDKGTTVDDAHGYTEFYQQFFEKYENPKILEIGTYKGASARMFNEFYDGECEIWTCDCANEFSKYVADMPNVHFIQLDANDMAWILQVKSDLSNIGFDIIIDDASHIWQHQMNLISGFHSLLNEGGIYIIEDIHYSRLSCEVRESPLFFLNFLWENSLITKEENDELIGKIKDIQIFSRKNHSYEMDTKWGGRSMTAVITFEK